MSLKSMENVMKRLIVATVLAMSSLAATAAPSYADSVTIRIGEPGRSDHRYYQDRYHHDRHHVRYDHCWKQPYHVWSHHHRITKYRTVCR